MNLLHPEFRTLAAARKIMARGAGTRTLDDDRASAERWISRFGAGADAVASRVCQGVHATTIYPAIYPAAASAAAGATGTRVFYIHGGGLVYYSSATFTPLLQFWADQLATPVEAFDYLKAPEHDVGDSVARLVSDIVSQIALSPQQPVILAGDSVGALLALYIAARVLPEQFSKLCLIYPVLDLGSEHPSYRRYGEGYFLDASAMLRFRSFLAPFFAAQGFDPFALNPADMAALPPCHVFSAGCDVLSDEAQAWTARLTAHGKAVAHDQFHDLPHDFCLYFGKLQSAQRAVVHILSNLK